MRLRSASRLSTPCIQSKPAARAREVGSVRAAARAAVGGGRSRPSACWACSSVYIWKISSVSCDATTSRIAATACHGCQPSDSESAVSTAM
eukprot:scaffold74230_cov63-Phaeocystis_antarctica.AAC.1